MIQSFLHKGLGDLWATGKSAKVAPDLQRRILRRLAALDVAKDLTELDQPGFNFHVLHGTPLRHTIHVNGPWCITFEWVDGDARRIDLQQHH